MVKRFCDICGKEMYQFRFMQFTEPDGTMRINKGETEDLFEICYDCEQAVRDCIYSRVMEARVTK